MRLEFSVASCIRATSKFSQCTKCVTVCPVSTIEIVDNIPAFTPSACIDCGGCVGVCPTEAFSLKGFSSINLFFELLESKKNRLSCKTEIPCLSILSVEHLISLALASEEPLAMNLEGCRCGGDSDRLTSQIRANIEEANFVLESFSDKRILSALFESEVVEDKVVSNRRSLFSLKEALKNKQKFDEVVDADELRAFELDSEVISKIKSKNIPDKRKLLYSILKRVEKPQNYDILASEDISFTSQKFIDESCTNCQICYRVCPTGALSSDSKFSVINFDSMMCLKCHLCHDVCEPNAIGIQAGFEIKELFEPTQRVLASFDIRRCNECGNHFTYSGGLVECMRCKMEESEAMELHINPKFF